MGFGSNPHVRLWPKADMPEYAIDVAIGGKADIQFRADMSAFDPKRTSVPFPVRV